MFKGEIMRNIEASKSKIEQHLSYEEAAKLTNLGLWEWSIDTDKVLLSEEIFNIAGLSPDDFDGTMTYIISKIIHPEDRMNFMKSMALARKEEIRRHRTYRVNHSKKEQCWVQFHTKIVYNEKNQVAKLQGTVLEVTDEYLKKKSIQQYLKFMNDIIETLPTPIYYKNEGGQYKFCNTAFLEFVGKEKKRCLAKVLKLLPLRAWSKCINMPMKP